MISRDSRMYCGHFVGPLLAARGWPPCLVEYFHAIECAWWETERDCQPELGQVPRERSGVELLWRKA